MRIPALISVLLAGVAATTVFFIACGAGPGPASAQSCAAWEVSTADTTLDCASTPSAGICRLADGWEPFAAPGFSTVFMRRCAH